MGLFANQVMFDFVTLLPVSFRPLWLSRVCIDIDSLVSNFECGFSKRQGSKAISFSSNMSFCMQTFGKEKQDIGGVGGVRGLNYTGRAGIWGEGRGLASRNFRDKSKEGPGRPMDGPGPVGGFGKGCGPARLGEARSESKIRNFRIFGIRRF